MMARKISLSRGSLINERYEVEGYLGSGSVGKVYTARDRELHSELVAIKLLHPHLIGDETSRTRFLSELVITRQLCHQNIIRLYDFGQSDSVCFLTMEYLPGANLGEILQGLGSKPLPFSDVLRIFSDIVSALACAHSSAVVHRDIKPKNILVSKSSNVKVTDFGVAYSLHHDHGLTKTGESLGTPRYMAPEQFLGQEADCRSDVYSLGILAYELVQGVAPFQADNFYALGDKHLKEELPRIDEDRRIPKPFLEMIGCATEKEPENRFASAKELLGILEQHNKKTNNSARYPLSCTKLIKTPLHRQYLSKSIFARLLPLILLAVFFMHFSGLHYLFPILEDSIALDRSLGLERLSITPFLIKRLQLPERENMGAIEVLRSDYPFHRGIERGLNRVLTILQDSWSDFDQVDEHGDTLLHVLARTTPFRIDLLPEIVRSVSRKTLDAKDQQGNNALLLAVRYKNTRLVKQLLIAGANPNLRDEEGSFALLEALSLDDYEILKILLKAALIDTSLRRSDRQSVYHVAVEEGKQDALKILVGKSNNLNIRNRLGRTPLMMALQLNDEKSRQEIVALFSNAHGVDLAALDNEGRSALHWAVEAGDWKSAKILIEKGVSCEGRDIRGERPIDLLARMKNSQFARAFDKCSANKKN